MAWISCCNGASNGTSNICQHSEMPRSIETGPTVMSLPNCCTGCLVDLNYQVALITHCAF